MGYLERDIEIILLLLRKQEWKKLTANKQVDWKCLKVEWSLLRDFFQVRRVLESRFDKLIKRFAQKLLTPILSLKYTDKALYSLKQIYWELIPHKMLCWA